ncbi:RNA repair domain-containing protein [Streptomyces sp. NPDC020875]|uniref:RNA repair domain-containing protein n=1 Tax=Streptomyces sp. NPDC020875 TaxID=3154898 RepID=UPI0033EA2836
MRTSEQIYHRVRWDARFDPGRFVIGVAQRGGAAPKRIPLPSFAPGGDVPWHRVIFFEADGERLWDRETGTDRLDTSDAGRARAPRLLAPPFFEPVAIGAVGADPGRAASRTPRVLTWNTLWDRYDAERVETARRRPLLLAALRAADAEVIALQEVEPPLYDLLRDAEWVRDGGWSLVPGRRAAGEYGLLIMSRLPVREAGLHVLGPHKAVLAVVVETAGGPLTVATTHLTSDHTADGPALRRAQLATLRRGLAGAEGDLVLMGDMNDATRLPGETLGLDDAWTDDGAETVPDDPDAPTFDPRVNPLAAISSLTGRAGRIDRVFLRGRYLAARARLVGTVPDRTGLYASDHYGVLAELAPRPTVPRPTADHTGAARAADTLRRIADAFPEGFVHLVGSRRTECELPGADLDLVAALPGTPAIEDVRERIRRAVPDAGRPRVVTGARSDGLRFSTGGLDVDLVVAGTGDIPPGRAVERRTELGEAAAIALSAVSDGDAVLQSAGAARRDDFTALARAVKAWARAKGLDSAPFGGLPGLGWAVLAARTVRDADPALLAAGGDEPLRHFFATWAARDWDADARDPVRLTTPTAPARSLTATMGTGARTALARELYDAWHLLETTPPGTDPWPALTAPPPLPDRHTAWAVISVPAPDPALLGRVRGRIRALIALLEESGLPDVQGWPHPLGTPPLHFTIGLGPTPPSPTRFTTTTAGWTAGLPGVTLTLRRELPGPLGQE